MVIGDGLFTGACYVCTTHHLYEHYLRLIVRASTGHFAHIKVIRYGSLPALKLADKVIDTFKLLQTTRQQPDGSNTHAHATLQLHCVIVYARVDTGHGSCREEVSSTTLSRICSKHTVSRSHTSGASAVQQVLRAVGKQPSDLGGCLPRSNVAKREEHREHRAAAGGAREDGGHRQRASAGGRPAVRAAAWPGRCHAAGQGRVAQVEVGARRLPAGAKLAAVDRDARGCDCHAAGAGKPVAAGDNVPGVRGRCRGAGEARHLALPLPGRAAAHGAARQRAGVCQADRRGAHIAGGAGLGGRAR